MAEVEEEVWYWLEPLINASLAIVVIVCYVAFFYMVYWIYGWFRGDPCKQFTMNIPALYSYSVEDGPHTWPAKFKIRGKRQSPLNIVTSSAYPVSCHQFLCFSDEYHTAPMEMTMFNDCHTVVINAHWEDDLRPTVMGGPLCEEYKFFNARIRWGSNENEGSEHLIDTNGYALEVQVAWNKFACPCRDITKASKTCAVLMISYFFELTQVDNPYLEPIILGLKYLRKPFSCYDLQPTPLALMFPSFTKHYYTYCGSLTFPPCTEGVRWIIQPEPLSVSEHQMVEFRKLCGCDGYIHNNTRPVQNVNGRDILYYN